MDGDIKSYKSIHWIILGGLFTVFLLLVLTSITSNERWFICLLGEHSFYLLKLMAWGGFGAIMHVCFLSARDKHANHQLELAKKKDATSEGPNYPDSYDVVMYFLYFPTGMVMAILSAFLLEFTVDYVTASGELAIKEKFGLFAIFAFYAGYSQLAIVGKLRKKASDS